MPRDLTRLQVLDLEDAIDGGATSAAQPAALRTTSAFVIHYLRSRPGQFLALFGVVLCASACAVGVQYGMKLIIDAMTSASGRKLAIHLALFVFIGLVALESLLWRLSGWLGSRATLAVGVDIKLDLFSHLAGHSLRYFQEQLAGALGHRLTATSGAFGALVSRMVWDVAPPVVNFIGALALFATLDGGMTTALAGFVALTTAALIGFGLRGGRHHRTFARRSSEAGGELMDVINNMVAVKAFSARERERARLHQTFGQESDAHGRSWMYNEKIRLTNDVALVLMAAGTLVWAAHLWQVGRITPGDVVLVSTLTFRLLHGSRDLAMSLIDMGQQYTFIGETLRLVGQPHALLDPENAAPHPGRQGRDRFRAGELRLSGADSDPAKPHPEHPRGPATWAGGRVGRGEIHPDPARPAAARREHRAHPARRPAAAGLPPGRASRPHRRGAPGGQPVPQERDGEHPLRAPRGQRRGGVRRRPRRLLRDLHRRPAQGYATVVGDRGPSCRAASANASASPAPS